jgi:hypothetical protein
VCHIINALVGRVMSCCDDRFLPGVGKDLLPAKWATRRPEELRPPDFLELTADLYGETSLPTTAVAADKSTGDPSASAVWSRDLFSSPWGKVWRGGVADISSSNSGGGGDQSGNTSW